MKNPCYMYTKTEICEGKCKIGELTWTWESCGYGEKAHVAAVAADKALTVKAREIRKAVEAKLGYINQVQCNLKPGYHLDCRLYSNKPHYKSHITQTIKKCLED